MNVKDISLFIFALVAISAVFAFILVLGDGITGQAGSKIGTSTFKQRDAFQACSISSCDDGLGGIPTGNYDPVRELYECRCKVSNPSFRFYRSQYAPG